MWAFGQENLMIEPDDLEKHRRLERIRNGVCGACDRTLCRHGYCPECGACRECEENDARAYRRAHGPDAA